jgi:hypothetical protein
MEFDVAYELAAALQNLLGQTYQMRDMFPDEDRTIAKAVSDAEGALRGYRESRVTSKG